VHRSEVYAKLLLNHDIFTIREEGIFHALPNSWHQSVPGKFAVVEFKYGWTAPPAGPARERQSLMKTMREIRAEPDTIENTLAPRWPLSPDVCFWFDVSSQKNPAYYCLLLKWYGTQTVIMVELHCTRIDEGVLRNVHNLDATLGLIMDACEIPT
jgi:hypothetical protein